MAVVPVHTQYADADLQAWQAYKKAPTPENRSKLLHRFDGLINNQVNKWAGPIARDILLNEAKLLAIKAFDTYNPNAGAAMSTYLTNALLPLSRVVYTYQNAARMPENITQKLHSYSAAKDSLTLTLGREPTTDELHNELGWSAAEITRIRDYNHRDLVESGPAVAGDFFQNNKDDEDDMLLGGIYFELNPEEKRLFEHTTGYNGAKILNNTAIMQKFGWSQAQLSYKKTLLRKRIEQLLKKYNR